MGKIVIESHSFLEYWQPLNQREHQVAKIKELIRVCGKDSISMVFLQINFLSFFLNTTWTLFSRSSLTRKCEIGTWRRHLITVCVFDVVVNKIIRWYGSLISLQCNAHNQIVQLENQLIRWYGYVYLQCTNALFYI